VREMTDRGIAGTRERGNAGGGRRGGERGAALVTVLLFVVLTFILITAMLSAAGNEIVIAGLQRDSARAGELAQAGIQEAMKRVAEGRPYLSGFSSSLVGAGAVPGATVNVTVVRQYTGTNSAYLEIRADATAGRATRRLSALVLQQQTALPPNVTFAASVSEQGSADIKCGDSYARTFIQYSQNQDPPRVLVNGSQAATDTSIELKPPACGKLEVGEVLVNQRTRESVRVTNYDAASYTASVIRGFNGSTAAPMNDGDTLLTAYTYAGWRASQKLKVAPCYTNADCASKGQPKWYPATRLGESEASSLGRDILAFAANAQATYPSCTPTNPAYTVTFSGRKQDNTNASGEAVYGFDKDDPDGGGPVPSQLDPDLFPCGLPYKWVAEIVYDENGLPVDLNGDGVADPIWFKHVVWEQYLKNYWRFNEVKMRLEKRNGTSPCPDDICLPNGKEPDLVSYPQFAAVPPFPQVNTLTNNYTCKMTGGGVLNSLPITCTAPDGSTITTDLGCKRPEMSGCAVSRQVTLVLEGNWTINGTIAGHGTIVVNGNLVVNGTFDYWGTIIVNGTLQAGTGNVNVHGGLVAKETLKLIGNITVEGGANVGGSAPTGRSTVVGRAWWER
jgi:hypothetical protein